MSINTTGKRQMGSDSNPGYLTQGYIGYIRNIYRPDRIHGENYTVQCTQPRSKLTARVTDYISALHFWKRDPDPYPH
jgi:hypothetical protein